MGFKLILLISEDREEGLELIDLDHMLSSSSGAVECKRFRTVDHSSMPKLISARSAEILGVIFVTKLKELLRKARRRRFFWSNFDFVLRTPPGGGGVSPRP